MVRNLGPASAREVDVEEVSLGISALISAGLPLPNLPPNHEYPIPYLGPGDKSPAVDLNVRWIDGAGEHSNNIRVYAI